MHFLERLLYNIFFMCYRWLPFSCFENILNKYENRLIYKYLLKGKTVKSTPIPTINAYDLTEKNFKKISENYSKPVLIKGFMKDAPAVSKWSLEYLRDIIDDDFEVNCVSYEKELKIIPLTFNEFIERKDENIYINNNHTLTSHFSRLFNDIKERFLLLKSILHRIPQYIHIANLFIGYGKNKGSHLHCGGSGNFFVQIVGRKHWTFIDPQHSAFLKGRLSESGIHAQTLFDMPDASICLPPRIFSYIPRYEVELEPGDIIWNAPWWWHRIRNTNDELNIGMAIRLNKVTKLNLQNNWLYTLSSYTYLCYNSLLIGLYERWFLKKGEHFSGSKSEKDKSNVLYQIDQLTKKYPRTLKIQNII